MLFTESLLHIEGGVQHGTLSYFNIMAHEAFFLCLKPLPEISGTNSAKGLEISIRFQNYFLSQQYCDEWKCKRRDSFQFPKSLENQKKFFFHSIITQLCLRTASITPLMIAWRVPITSFNNFIQWIMQERNYSQKKKTHQKEKPVFALA